MPVEVRVPQLGESIVEATVGQWLKGEGDTVAAGEPLVELETDKVNMEVAASGAGVLQSIVKQAGETVGIGDVLALVGDGAGAGAAATPDAANAAAASTAPVPPAVPPAAASASGGAPTFTT
ncbi:MAG: dihydrolipoyllysine-residue succinyltransferase, partial [Chloroflexota bacterium]|nr:dihydrolipoyllysine-residue succinyltransferase [Chloroflexota bacterium]